MTPDLAALWQHIEDDAVHEEPQRAIRRLVENTGSAEIHLGRSADGHRQVWVRVGDGWTGDISKLPRWRGVKLSLHTGPERPRARTFIILEQADGRLHDIFVPLAGYVCQALERAPSATPAESTLSLALDAWRAFFEQDGLDGLAREAQQGLWGELWFLRDYLIPRLGPAAALEGWTGPLRTNHDFQRHAHAIEVKTTSGRRHHALRIKSERQLDTTGISSLHVVFLTLARIENGGETLPGLVAALRKTTASSPSASRQLEEALLAAHYVDIHAHQYRTGFACRDVKAFAVRDGFPRITENDIPDGTGDVSYSVSLDACAPFVVPLNDALNMFGSP